jgi:Tfp pilus assembly protein FimT
VASQRTTVIAVVALVVALALPLYFVVIKKRAAASLEDLLAERFKTTRACPLAQVDVPSGGHITCQIAFEDSEQAGTLLVLGSWARGTVKVPGAVADVDNKVAGIYKPSTDWLARVRADQNLIAAIEAPGGALAFWSGLPDRASVLAHLEAAK